MSKHGKYKEGITALLSKCCNAEVKAYHSDEGTSYWYCSKCGNATDPKTPMSVVKKNLITEEESNKEQARIIAEASKKPFNKKQFIKDAREVKKTFMNTPTTQSLEDSLKKILGIKDENYDMFCGKWKRMAISEDERKINDLVSLFSQEQEKLMEQSQGLEEETVIRNIFNLATTYTKNDKRNEIWLKAQIGNQLQHYKQYVESQEQKRLIKLVEEKVIGEDEGFFEGMPASQRDYNRVRNYFRDIQRKALSQLEREL